MMLSLRFMEPSI